MGRRYTLISRLEEGALAELFEAKAEGPGAPDVLVKLFNPKVSDPAYAKALADVGARALALGHPQALGHEEVGMVGGRIAAVRPHFKGFSLGDALRRLMSKEVVLPPAVAIFLVAEAAQVVAQAHARGWAHGAITPGNILLGFDGKVRVADFGALEAMSATPALKALASKGRHAYRAPEQKDPWRGAAAGDVYSLGAIAYELLTLREVAQSRGGGLSTKRDSLPAPSRVDRRLNARMDPVVMRALELAAPRRYRTAADYSEALRGLFTVLGYAPGLNEVVRFVKELFPNEVSIGGIGGELPINGPFALDQVVSDLPAVQLDPTAEFDERASFTTSELDSLESFESAAGEPPASAFEAPPAAAAVAPAAAEPAADYESWEAPPGQMPEAPRLSRRAAAQPAPTLQQMSPVEPTHDELADTFMRDAPRAPRREPQPVAEQRSASRAAPPVEDPRHQTPVETPAALAEGGSRKQLSTSIDWHVPPSPPDPKPARPRVGFGVWAMGLVGCALASALVYLAVSRKLGIDPGDAPAIELPAPDGVLPQAVPDHPESPAPERAAAPDSARLSVEADVPAAVFVDGRDIFKTLPLVGHPLPPGKHTVLLVHGEEMREFTVQLSAGQEEKRVESFGAPPPAVEPPATKPTVKPATKATTKPVRKRAPARKKAAGT